MSSLSARFSLTIAAGVIAVLISGCTSSGADENTSAAGCVDANASNPTLVQALEGNRDSMLRHATTPEEAESFRTELAPEAVMASMERVGTLDRIKAIVDGIPAGGYREYVKAVCSLEQQWRDNLDGSQTRWAMAWDGIEICQVIIGKPDPDAYVAGIDKSGTDFTSRFNYTATTAARKHLCPRS